MKKAKIVFKVEDELWKKAMALKKFPKHNNMNDVLEEALTEYVKRHKA